MFINQPGNLFNQPSGGVPSDDMDVSDALSEWERDAEILTVTKTTVDFEPVETVTSRSQLCVCQPADKEMVNADNIDWSIKNLMVHSRFDLKIGEYINHRGGQYKVIHLDPWDGYGYRMAVAAENKGKIYEVTPEPDLNE